MLPLVIGTLWIGVGCGHSTSEPRRSSVGDGGSDAGSPSDEGGAPSVAGASFVGDAATAGVPLPVAGAGVAGDGDPSGTAGAPAAPQQLSLRAISISQTHELPLMQAGTPVAAAARPAPLVAGKQALVRVFVDVEPSFVGRPLLGVLDLKTPQVTRTLVSERSISQSSLADDLTTTFVFNVEAGDLAATSTYRVRVLEADTTPLARFPDTGYAKLDAQTLGPFELVVVPFITNGITPKMGDEEVLALRHRLLALFPSPVVDISIAAAVTLPGVVNGDGDGWDPALDEIYAQRAKAAPNHDVFYYGMMAPSATYGTFCANGCTLGLSNVAGPDEVEWRGAIGVTVFPDGSGAKDAWDTLAHELGHAMGREHAPCGVDDPDPDYPYINATMGGIYGYDFDLMRLVKPKPSKDVMSYCSPVWISDYTYRGLFERLEYIGSESFKTLAAQPSELFRLARIDRNGHSLWLREQRRHRAGRARVEQLDLLDGAGRSVGSVRAEIVAVDHAAGGYLWLPAAALGAFGNGAAVDLRPLGGAILPL
jgi:Peptidase M66